MRNEAGWMKPDFRFKTIKQNATQSQIYQSTGRKMNLIFTRNSPELLIFDLENHQKMGKVTHVSMAVGNVIGQF